MLEKPEARYARNGDIHIAYQVVGDGPVDLVFCAGIFSNIEVAWELPEWNHLFQRLASFSRLIIYDLRGIGLSDRGKEPPYLEIQMDDLRSVMDSAGSKSAFVFGVARGSVPAMLFAATHPERVKGLVLYSPIIKAMRTTEFPFGMSDEEREDLNRKIIEPFGTGTGLATQAPSALRIPNIIKWWARFERLAASPGAVAELLALWRQIDLTAALPSIQAPTLILHRSGDQIINREQARYAASKIPDSRLVSFEGDDHLPIFGDSDAVIDEVAEFVSGDRPKVETERILTTVLFVDLVGSTDRASAVGDRAWKLELESFYRATRTEVERFNGRFINTTGDGALACFDGPARATHCAISLIKKVQSLDLDLRAGLHTGECELVGDDLGGIAVHMAARIMSQAGQGEILVSGTVHDLTMGSNLRFTPKGSHTLKGIPGEWPLYAAG